VARGFGAGFDLSFTDKDHRVYRTSGFSPSTIEVRRARIAVHNDLIARGFKPICSNEFSLARFMPAAEAIQTIETTAPVVVRKIAA
jgi:hypothetical protein